MEWLHFIKVLSTKDREGAKETHFKNSKNVQRYKSFIFACTNTNRKIIDGALARAKQGGIRKFLALREDLLRTKVLDDIEDMAKASSAKATIKAGALKMGFFLLWAWSSI